MKPSRRNLANVARLEEKLKQGPKSKYALKRMPEAAKGAKS
jgi:hypothetical protein